MRTIVVICEDEKGAREKFDKDVAHVLNMGFPFMAHHRDRYLYVGEIVRHYRTLGQVASGLEVSCVMIDEGMW